MLAFHGDLDFGESQLPAAAPAGFWIVPFASTAETGLTASDSGQKDGEGCVRGGEVTRGGWRHFHCLFQSPLIWSLNVHFTASFIYYFIYYYFYFKGHKTKQ